MKKETNRKKKKMRTEKNIGLNQSHTMGNLCYYAFAVRYIVYDKCARIVLKH